MNKAENDTMKINFKYLNIYSQVCTSFVFNKVDQYK